MLLLLQHPSQISNGCKTALAQLQAFKNSAPALRYAKGDRLKQRSIGRLSSSVAPIAL